MEDERPEQKRVEQQRADLVAMKSNDRCNDRYFLALAALEVARQLAILNDMTRRVEDNE